MATLQDHLNKIEATAAEHRRALEEAGFIQVSISCFMCGRVFKDINGKGITSPATYALERHLIDDHHFYSWHDKQLSGAGHHSHEGLVS